MEKSVGGGEIWNATRLRKLGSNMAGPFEESVGRGRPGRGGTRAQTYRNCGQAVQRIYHAPCQDRMHVCSEAGRHEPAFAVREPVFLSLCPLNFACDAGRVHVCEIRAHGRRYV